MSMTGDEDTMPPGPRSGVQRRPGAEEAPPNAKGAGDDVSLGEVTRALKYIEERVNDTHRAVNGNPADSEDTGLKGAVQQMSGEVRALRTLVLALIILVALPVVAIAVRATDATGREWGLWSPPQRAQVEVRR